MQDICICVLLNSTGQAQASSPIHSSEVTSLWHLRLLKHMSPCLLALSLIMLVKYLSCMCIGKKNKKKKRGEKVAVQRCGTAEYFCPCRESRRVESIDVLISSKAEMK